MKHFTFVGIFFSTLIVLSCLSACKLIKYSYSFAQGKEEVKIVELCRYDYSTKTIEQIKTLDEDTARGLLSDISNMDAYRNFGDYDREDFGHIVIYITYQNGEHELIGAASAATADASGNWQIKNNWFESSKWCEVLLKYIDASLVPELMNYT